MNYLITPYAEICQHIYQLRYSDDVMSHTSFDCSNALSPTHKYLAVLMLGGASAVAASKANRYARLRWWTGFRPDILSLVQ